MYCWLSVQRCWNSCQVFGSEDEINSKHFVYCILVVRVQTGNNYEKLYVKTPSDTYPKSKFNRLSSLRPCVPKAFSALPPSRNNSFLFFLQSVPSVLCRTNPSHPPVKSVIDTRRIGLQKRRRSRSCSTTMGWQALRPRCQV